MTARRACGNVVARARDQSADTAQEIIRTLEPVLDGSKALTPEERIRRESKALHLAHTIVHMMAEIGAPIRVVY